MIMDYKAQTRKQWNRTPCGTGDFLSGLEPESLEWFDEIRRSRFETTDTWMPRVVPYGIAEGKRLLEIGHGIGSDLLTFAEHGAEVHGVDITPEHHRLAKRNFELHETPVKLTLCDSNAIDYPSEYFDFVYSHGVLHHTPDTVRCISEAYRVLKPGGTLILSMYRKWSAFHIFHKILLDGVVRRKLWTHGYDGMMATLENGADGINVKPLVKTYSRTQLRHILGDFSSVSFRAAHFTGSHLVSHRLGKLFPSFLERALEPALGWYLLAFATK